MKYILEDDTVNRVVFHFNKAHNQDKTIPMWVVKHKGNTYYVNHLDSKVGFSTKETPDNEHTKGSLMFRGKIKISEKDGESIAEVY
jgi:hypothetical protein